MDASISCRRSFLPLLLLCLALVRPGTAEPPGAVDSSWTVVPAPARMLGLEECIALALQQQPALAAQRASLAAAEDGCRALDDLRVPTCLARDLPIRRQQAALGVSAAAAALDQAERQTIYAVTRTYFTVLYAREQEAVAGSVVQRLATTNEVAGTMLQAGAAQVTSADLGRSTVYLELARTKQVEAARGVDRALAALREAIGLGPECRLQVPAGHLAEPTVRPSRQEVVAWAVARANALIQVRVLAEVSGLEVAAQATSLHLRMETFASGADIHAHPIPQEIQNHDYRPGAVPPEMPTILAGPRGDRVQRAQSFHARAAAVETKTRNLIALEAEDAYFRWEEASQQAVHAKKAAQAGDKLASELNKDFTGGLKIKVEDVINAHVLASQAHAQYNEFLYREIVALADLERVTAGAFVAGLAPRTVQLGEER